MLHRITLVKIEKKKNNIPSGPRAPIPLTPPFCPPLRCPRGVSVFSPCGRPGARVGLVLGVAVIGGRRRGAGGFGGRWGGGGAWGGAVGRGGGAGGGAGVGGGGRRATGGGVVGVVVSGVVARPCRRATGAVSTAAAAVGDGRRAVGDGSGGDSCSGLQ